MRWSILIVAVMLSVTADAQVRTKCVRTDGVTVNCVTTGQQQPLGSYANALGAAQRLVPNYQDQQHVRQQTEQLRLQNEMMRRQMERDAASGYGRKQCRQSAKAAIGADDLALARDVLNACAGQ